jgi:pyrroline-5-carboxylate reductase
MNITIGIIGVGHLASYIVAGLMDASNPPRIILSPRGADTAARLSTKYDLEIADSNEAVVENADVVLLATRPPDLLDAITGLPWRDGQTAVSLAAGVALSGLQHAVSPATAVRTLPVTAAEIRESPTCLFPENTAARTVFEQLGSVHVFDDEETYELASIQGVIFSVFHAGIQSIAEWMEDTGLDKVAARELAARALRATGGMVLAHPENDFDHMVAEYATEGTLTLMALQELKKNGGLSGWPEALGAALEKGRAINRDTQ